MPCKSCNRGYIKRPLMVRNHNRKTPIMENLITLAFVPILADGTPNLCAFAVYTLFGILALSAWLERKA